MGKKKRAPAVETFDYSIGDPAFADFLRMSGVAWGGGELGEQGALGLTAYYNALRLISGTIASLPLRVYERVGATRVQQDHYLSGDPAGPYDLSEFAWKESVVLHQLLHGECFLRAIANQGGEVIGQYPVHPLAVTKVVWDGFDKQFTVALTGGANETIGTGEMTHIPVMSTDGLRGLSPLTLFRKSLQTAQQGELAANRSFVTGALISGMVTTEEDVDAPEAQLIKEALNAKIAGADNAGAIAFVNRSLKFSPWKMNNVDAQFLESRKFSVEEMARITGLPISLMNVVGAVSNWGTGVAESFLGLQKFTLMPITSRIESGLRAVLPPGWFVEFDYKGLLQGSPAVEIELLIAQVAGGLLTANEARAIMNLPPLPEPVAPAFPPQEEPTDGQV